MAVAYSALAKYPEAYALFERAVWRKNEADKLVKKLKGNKYFNESTEELVQLGKTIEKDREHARSKQLADLDGTQETQQALDEKVVSVLYFIFY